MPLVSKIFVNNRFKKSEINMTAKPQQTQSSKNESLNSYNSRFISEDVIGCLKNNTVAKRIMLNQYLQELLNSQKRVA